MDTTTKLFERWLKGLAAALIIFALFSIYLFLRRGYFNVYIANKSFAGTAAVLAGIALILQPLSKHWRWLIPWMARKRQLGLSALGFALIHIGSSIILLQDKFPLSWYLDKMAPTLAGIIALVIWIFLAYLSRDKKVEELGFPLWKKYQSWGARTAFLAVYLHLLMKYYGWLDWFTLHPIESTPELKNPSYPPSSLLVLVFMTAVIIYKALSLLFARRSAAKAR
jgi:hypothetical protein